MISGVVEGGIALLVAILGGIFIFGQLKENARKNEVDIAAIRNALSEGQEAVREMIKENQESMMSLLSKNMEDMKQLLDREKSNSREALQNEIAHLRELVNINASETRADIQRLQMEQKESNNLKTKVALLTSSVKALHHRLDIDPPTLLEDE